MTPIAVWRVYGKVIYKTRRNEKENAFGYCTRSLLLPMLLKRSNPSHRTDTMPLIYEKSHPKLLRNESIRIRVLTFLFSRSRYWIMDESGISPVLVSGKISNS